VKASTRRFFQLLTRLFNVTQESPVSIGAISPGIALETEDAQELDLLRGWRRFGLAVSPGPVAGQFIEFLLDNPAASKTLIRLEAIAVFSASAGDSFGLRQTNGGSLATFTAQGSGVPLDQRVRTTGGYQNSAATLYARTSAAVFGGARFATLYTPVANTPVYASRAEARVVLDPGTQLLVSGQALNAVQKLGLIWAERDFDSWEKYPIQ